MLARYVLPKAAGGGSLSRTEVFRFFVEETIQGKLRASSEAFPFPPESASQYRLLLQEMAYLASWPNANGKCSERALRERLQGEPIKVLNFEGVRTAFVLHFFDPG